LKNTHTAVWSILIIVNFVSLVIGVVGGITGIGSVIIDRKNNYQSVLLTGKSCSLKEIFYLKIYQQS
jgi:hypothetical protein